MHLIIFKTSVANRQQAAELQSLLNALPFMIQCNFDLDDCDKILRVISNALDPEAICQTLHTRGFICESMESFVYQH